MRNTSLLIGSISLFFYLAGSYPLFSQVQLIGDPSPNIGTMDSGPIGFVEMDGINYFIAEDQWKSQLWRTDGTEVGTYPVVAGAMGALAVDTVGHFLYFVMDQCHTGIELGRSNGTLGNLEMIEIIPGKTSLRNIERLKWAGGKIFFHSTLRPGVGQFYAIDPATGTSELLLDEDTGGNATRIFTNYKAFDSKMYVPVRDISGNNELWLSDGTPGNTGPLIDFTSQSWTDFPFGFEIFNGSMYFFVSTSNGRELWKTDGTGSGTIPVGSVGSNTGLINRLIPMDDAMYFLAIDFALSDSILLMKTHGIPGDISYVATLSEGSVQGIERGGDQLMVVIRSAASNAEFWRSDGTTPGTQLYLSLSGVSDLEGVAVHDSLLLFNYQDSLWRTDGTSTGSFSIGQGQGYHFEDGAFLSYEGRLFYRGFVARDLISAPDQGVGNELYVTNGTRVGSDLFFDLNPYPFYTGFTALSKLDDKWIFTATNDSLINVPWITDGTLAGTKFLKDLTLNLRPQASNYTLMGSSSQYGDDLYFTAWNFGSQEFQLWRTNGTDTGTVRIATSPDPAFINPDPETRAIYGQTTLVYNGSLYFSAPFESSGNTFWGTELWRIPSPGASPEFVVDIFAGQQSGDPTGFVEVNGLMVFTAVTQAQGRELWVSDGTASGTQLLKEFRAGSASAFNVYNAGMPNAPQEGLVGNQLFFPAISDAEGRELWITDATSPGTRLVKDIRPGPGGSDPRFFAVMGQQLFFFAADSAYGYEPWISDGTETGTTLLKDVFPGTGGSMVTSISRPLIATDSVIFFNAYDGVAGDELWRTDGTPSGTYMLKDLAPGPFCSTPGFFVRTDSMVYFIASDAHMRQHIWQTDGTEAGTHIADGFPVDHSLYILQDLIAADTALYFTAIEPSISGGLFRFSPGSGITGIENAHLSTISIFPNPTSDILNIEIPVSGVNMRAIVIDAQGRIVLDHQLGLTPVNHLSTLDVSALGDGMYVLLITSASERMASKFIIMRN